MEVSVDEITPAPPEEEGNHIDDFEGDKDSVVGTELAVHVRRKNRSQDDGKDEESSDSTAVEANIREEVREDGCVMLSNAISSLENRLTSLIDDRLTSSLEYCFSSDFEDRIAANLEHRFTDSLADSLVTRLERGMTQAVLQLKEVINDKQVEDRTEGNENAQEQPLSVKESRSDIRSTASVVSTTEGDEPKNSNEFADVWSKGMQKIIASIERPKPAMPTFTGKSRKEFSLFMRRFNGYIENNSVEASSKLEMLITACSGEDLKNALINYTRLDPEEGYKEAVAMLQQRLGNTQDHMDETIFELQSGPPIKDNDPKGVRCLIDKIWDALIDLDMAGRRSDLDNFGMITRLAERLTGGLRKRYEHQLHKYKRKHEARPGIKWFREELEDYECQLQQAAVRSDAKLERKDTRITKGVTEKAEERDRRVTERQ